jgi:ComEC/Rec2-related protein
LIAVSGLHVGVVALLVHAAMLRIVTMLGARLLWSTIAAIGAVVAFVAFTGAAAPAVRAAIMVGVASVGAIVGRPVHGPTTLGAAVAAMLVVRPAWALDPGFHLSVVAMSVLVLRPHRGALGQTWAIGWAIVPVCLWHFGTTSPFAVITNLLVLPLFTLWVLPVGAFGWFGAWGWGPGALAPAALGADVLLRIATWVASWPAPSDWALAGIASTLALGRWVAPVRFRRLVPRVPVWVALAIVSVQLVRSGGVELREARWVALGTGRRPTVVRWVEDGRACLLDPRGPSAAWPSRLRALGVREVVGFGEVDSRRPDLAEVASRLDEAGMWRQDATIGCERPSSAEIREARRACTAAFVGTVAVASVRPAGRVRCYAENRWSPMVFSQAET